MYETMATLTLMAGKLAGVGMTTLMRAIKCSRLLADRRGTGGYRIDSTELARVFDIKHAPPATGGKADPAVHRAPPSERDPDVTARRVAAVGEIKGLREILVHPDADRYAWRPATENALATVTPLTDQSSRESWCGDKQGQIDKVSFPKFRLDSSFLKIHLGFQ